MTKKKTRKWYFFFLIISWVVLFMPIGIWIGINFNDYIIQKSGITVSIGGVIAGLLVFLLIKYGVGKFHKIVWMSALLLSVFCLDTIIADALPITFFAWLGVLLFSILEIPTKHFKNKLAVYSDEATRTTARKEIIEEQETINLRKTKINGRC